MNLFQFFTRYDKRISLLLSTGFCWAFSFFAMDFIFKLNVTCSDYLFFQTLFTTIFLLFSENIRKLINLIIKNAGFFILASLLGIIIPNFLNYFLLNFISINEITIITNMSALLIYPISLIIGKERNKRTGKLLFAGLIGLTGMSILLFKQLFAIKIHNSWILLAMIVPISLALCSIYIENDSKKTSASSQSKAAGFFLVGSLFLFFFLFFMPYFPKIHSLHSKEIMFILISSLFTAIGIKLMFKFIYSYDAVTYSYVSPMTIISVMTINVTFLHIKISVIQIFAAIITISGLIFRTLLLKSYKKKVL